MIRVGTRGSALALAQAAWVGSRLDGAFELVRVTTFWPVSKKTPVIESPTRTSGSCGLRVSPAVKMIACPVLSSASEV